MTTPPLFPANPPHHVPEDRMPNTQSRAEQPTAHSRVDGGDHRLVLQVGVLYGDITVCTAHPSTCPRAAREQP